MKKILWLLVIGYWLLVIAPLALAVSPTPTGPNPTPTKDPNAISQQINNLQERIASRVAQLKLVEHRGIIGTVTDVTQTQITITDIQGNTRFIDVDEITKFSNPSAKGTFGISDIQKGQTVGILGLYNKESRRLLGRFVDVLTLPVYYSGATVATDKTNFTVDIVTVDQQTFTVDIQDITKTLSYTTSTNLVKSGFSKLTTGERIITIGFPDVKDSKKILATRVIFFPDLPINPSIQTIKLQNNTPPPSTGSGKKLVPLTR